MMTTAREQPWRSYQARCRPGNRERPSRGALLAAVAVSGVECFRPPHVRSQASPSKEISMNQHSHQTAPTQFVEAIGIRFAYRRFGKTGGVQLVFIPPYQGTIDSW